MSNELKITRTDAIAASKVIRDFCERVDDCNESCPFFVIKPNGACECGLMKDPSRWDFQRFSESEKKYAKALSFIGVKSIVRRGESLYCDFGDGKSIGMNEDVFPNVEDSESVSISEILGFNVSEKSSIFQF